MNRSVVVPLVLLAAAPVAWSQGGGGLPAPAAARSPRARLSAQEQSLVSASRLGSFLSAMQADRFQVTPGVMYLPSIVELACQGIAPSCNGNNNTNPYLVAVVPKAGQVIAPEDVPKHLNFQMRRDEAVVLVGRTPPPVAYFSFTGFILNRYFESEGIRRKVFASAVDPHNMLTLKTSGKASGDPYDRAFVLVVASDKGTRKRVHDALEKAGYPGSIVNDLVYSPNLARMSSKENGDADELKDDDFVILERFALWEYGYEEAGSDYLHDPPVNVFRLTPNPRTAKEDYVALPVEKIRPRGTGLTEMDLLPEVEALRDAIVARNPGMRAEELRPATWLEESFVALQKETDVLGESRDTVYLRNAGTFRLGKDDFVMVYGVNHEKSGKATYAGFTVYDECRACPYAGGNSRSVAGSALDYFPAGSAPAHVSSLYAWKLARECGSDVRCTEVPDGICSSDPPGIPLDREMFVGFRAYVEPSTKVGPAFTEVVYDRVLRFTPKALEIGGVTATADGSTQPGALFPAGTLVHLRFRVTGVGESPVTWSAAVKCDDGCGEFLPAGTGTLATDGEVDVQLKVPPEQRTLLTVFLDATDGKGLNAKTYGLQIRYY